MHAKSIDRRHHLLLLGALLSAGCAKTVDMKARGGNSPHATIPYTGVRNDGTRYEDYSVVDGAILMEKSPQDGKNR